MKHEPVGILAALAGIVSWVLHTYIPNIPVEIVSAIGVIVSGLARQFVVPSVKLGPPLAKSTKRGRKGPDAAAVGILLLLATSAPSEAQGIRDTLEQLGRGVAADAARQAADRLAPEPEPEVSPADISPGARSRPGESLEEFSARISRENTENQVPGSTDAPLRLLDLFLIVAVIIGLGGIVAMLLKNSGGAVSITKVGSTVRQASRVLLIGFLYGGTFGLVVWVEHLEQLNRGHASVLNQIHQGLGVLEAFLGATLIVFLIYDLLLMRFFTASELATGDPDPGREGISLIKKMNVTMRLAFIHGMYGLWISLVLIYGFGQGI